MGFKQKVFSDAGVITPPTFLTKEIFDQSSATGPKQFFDGYTEVQEETAAMLFMNQRYLRLTTQLLKVQDIVWSLQIRKFVQEQEAIISIKNLRII